MTNRRTGLISVQVSGHYELKEISGMCGRCGKYHALAKMPWYRPLPCPKISPTAKEV